MLVFFLLLLNMLVSFMNLVKAKIRDLSMLKKQNEKEQYFIRQCAFKI